MKKNVIKQSKKDAKKSFIFSIIPYIITLIIILLAFIIDPMWLWFLVAWIWCMPIAIPILSGFAISFAIKSLKVEKNPLAIISISLIVIPIICILLLFILMII